MPKIPEYSQQTTTRPVLGQARGPDNQIASALAGLGQDLQGVANNEQSMAMRNKQLTEQMAERDAHLWATEQASEIRRQSLEGVEQLKTVTPPGAQDFTKGVNKSYEEELSSRLESAPNQRSRDLLEMHGREFQNTLFNHAITYEAGERNRFANEQQVAGVNKESLDISKYPDMANEIWKTRIDAVSAQAMTPAVREANVNYTSKVFSKALIDGEGRANPAQTLERLTSDYYQKQHPWFNMDEKQLEQTINRLHRQVDSRDRAATTEVIMQVADHMANLRQGPVNAEGQITEIDKFVAKDGSIVWPNNMPDKLVRSSLGEHGYAAAVQEIKTYVAAAPLLALVKQSPIDVMQKHMATTWTPGTQGVIGEKVRTAVEQAISAEVTLRDKDPGAAGQRTAFENDPTGYQNDTILGQFKRNIDAQVRLGIPMHKQQPASAAFAKSEAAKILGMDSNEMGQYINQLEQSLVNPRSGRPDTSITNKFMAQLYGEHLPSSIMFANIAADTPYKSYWVQAATLKSAQDLKAAFPDNTLKEVQTAVFSAANDFGSVIALTKGIGGNQLKAEFMETYEKAVLFAMKDSGKGAADVIKAMRREIIDGKYELNTTYLVPKRDPVTGVAYSGKQIEKDLSEILRSPTWRSGTGDVFVPDVQSTKPKLSGTKFSREELHDATNKVWLNNSSNDGVYLAIQASRLPGIYIPVLNSKQERLEIRFENASFVARGNKTYTERGKIK